jgi:hypothetical protein
VTGEGASGGDASGGGVTGDEAAWRDLVARYEMPAEWDAASVPWPDRENLTERPREEPSAPGPASAARPESPSAPGPATDRTRVIRPATPPPKPDPVPAPEPAAAPPEDEDEHFIPPAPPPLPHLDPIAKGAWTALFGGPAYLVLASIIGWNVPGWAALLAVMAFVGGFAVVVLRLGDGPSRGDGPDNGAVI